MLLILQLLIKEGDHTFNGIFDFSFRSIIFFFGFIIYWMVSWMFFSWSIDKLQRRIDKKLSPALLFIILSFIMLILSLVAAILFNLFYRSFDIHFFGMAEVWNHVPFPHLDLIYPLALISLLIFIVDRFLHFADQLKNAELYAVNLEQVAMQSKYEALKNQIDPHFFFNSLSVLSSIVHSYPDLSAKYIYNLSKLYRYTLETHRPNIVTLTEELNSLESYIFLINLNNATTNQIGVHHGSLQLLVENAIKHNTFKESEPLVVEIFEDGGYVCVRNAIRKRKPLIPSTGVGLENIRRRYELQGNKKIIIEEVNNYFIVKLPKIEIEKNEDRNC